MAFYTFLPNSSISIGSAGSTINGSLDGVSQTSLLPSGSGNGVIPTRDIPVPPTGGKITKAWIHGYLLNGVLNTFTIYDVIWTRTVTALGVYNITAPSFPTDRGSAKNTVLAVYAGSLASNLGTVTYLDSAGVSFTIPTGTVSASSISRLQSPPEAVGVSKVTQISATSGSPNFTYFILKPVLVIGGSSLNPEATVCRDTTLFSEVVYPNSYLLYTVNGGSSSSSSAPGLVIEIN